MCGGYLDLLKNQGLINCLTVTLAFHLVRQLGPIRNTLITLSSLASGLMGCILISYNVYQVFDGFVFFLHFSSPKSS